MKLPMVDDSVSRGVPREVPREVPRDGQAAPAGGATVVGRVLGTQSATPLSFWIGLEPGQIVQLDDVVATWREVPGRGRVLVAGVVTDVQAMHEGASYDSDVFLIAGGVLPAAVVETAEVTVTRVEPEVYVPPLPGSIAY